MSNGLAAPNDPLYTSGLGGSPAVGQWYLKPPAGAVLSSIDAESAWDITQGSSSIVVAVLDTGVDNRPGHVHPDLAGKLLAGYDFVGWSGDNSVSAANDGDLADSDPSDPGDWITAAEDNDTNGEFYHCGSQDDAGSWIGSDSTWHGTPVAGLIGAATHNAVGMAAVAPGVSLLPVRVLGKCGGYDSDIIAGMRWAAGLSVPGVTPTNSHPARVLNLSLGSSGSCSQAYRDALAELTPLGVLVVAAAGNDGLAVGVPGNCGGVVAVAGVRHTGTKVGYSNLGPEVTVSAPAGNCVNETGECLYPILTTSNTGTTSPLASTYTTGGANVSLGTSFSTPLVSGTAALMLSLQPSLSNAQLIAALKASARPFPTSGAGAGVSTCQAPTSLAQDSECYCTTSTCGAGLLDAHAALANLVAVVPAFSATPASPQAGATVELDGSASQVGSGRTIASYLWEITSGSDLAAFSGATNGATASLVTSAAGHVVLQLTVTDNQGQSASTSQTLTITAAPVASGGSGGGGGAWSPAWALGLLLAAAALPRRRRRRLG
jgi:serine protease